MSTIYLEENLVIYKRESTYYMRLKTAPQTYVYRSLKTHSQVEARKRARRQLVEFEIKQERGEQFTAPTLKQVIAEYTKMRELDNQRGKTSDAMLRQIVRVNKFWIEYAGNLRIDKITNKELADFIPWRKTYYSKFKVLPKNAKLHPQDKTLHFELTHAKTIIRWATERGYRGTLPLPTYQFKIERRIVRPAFEMSEYRTLYKTLRRRITETYYGPWVASRRMLRDYVLILANTGMRVGELNSLKLRDIHPFKDEEGRENYRLIVRGKTGERDVIPRVSCKAWIDRVLQRRKQEGAAKNDYLFVMPNGGKIISLGDQFNAVLEVGNIVTNTFDKKFTLYSLRHLYAVQALRKGISVYGVARNMGTSVQVIQHYYGQQATSVTFATELGN
jgi:integrase